MKEELTKNQHPHRTYNFEGLKTGITVQVRSPEQNIQQKLQINQLLKSADMVLIPPEKSPLHLPYLYNGSQFKGVQASINQNYNVKVDIKSVDLCQDYLCGYLTIDGLTETFPTLTTFFEGEVIGRRYKFRTGGRWKSSARIDYRHWIKFDAFKNLLEVDNIKTEDNLFNEDNIDLDSICPLPLLQSPGLFMRWKELFLIPDHRIEKIEGASYDGFYYMYYDRMKNSFEGYYFHEDKPGTEQFQHIGLNYIEERTSGYAAFR